MSRRPSSDFAPLAPAGAGLGLAPFHPHNDTRFISAGKFGDPIAPVVWLDVDGDPRTLAAVLAARSRTLARLVVICRTLPAVEAPDLLRTIEPIAEELAELARLVGERLARDGFAEANGGQIARVAP